MTERFRNQSQAFRAFDATGKGKVFKSHFVESLERLRIRLSGQDISKIWACLDPQRRGYITFNEFCLLQHLRTSKHQDPFNIKALETKVMDQRAKGKLIERERRVREMIESMPSPPSSSMDSSRLFGLTSMPKDDMNQLLQGDYQRDFIQKKNAYDESIA